MAGCTGACYTDSDGALVDIRTSTSSVYPSGITSLHRRIEGSTVRDPSLTVPEPPLDVRQAWRDGWTGEGVNILIVDSFGINGRRVTNPLDRRGIHGYTVGMSAAEIAPDGTYYALEAGLNGEGTTYRRGGVRGGSTSTRFHVINLSFGLINPSSGTPTTAEVNTQQRSLRFLDLLGTSYLTNTQDAVITKAAGNNGGDAGAFADTVALVTHSSTGPRVLIVGALDRYARTSNPQNQPTISTRAGIARYSARAGGNTAVQDRFLVEYGGTPYGERAYLCDASTPARIGCANAQVLDTQSPYQQLRGTSFAAPRIAGFAALVRDKFPNLGGAQTANILLETATTMGLTCHTGTARKSSACARNIYGQGRVDIGAALAPVGSVR